MSTFWAPCWFPGRGSEQSPLPAAGRGVLAPREHSASVVEVGTQEGTAGHTAWAGDRGLTEDVACGLDFEEEYYSERQGKEDRISG